MKKFWVRPDGNDEEEEEKFEFRRKLAIISSLLLFIIIFFVVFPWWDKKTDEYWLHEAMRSSTGNYLPTNQTSHKHVFRED